MPELSTLQQIAIWIIPVLFAITIHEAAHGWVAYRLGDSTAKLLGRVSFNPLRHIDLVGTIIVPVVVLIVSKFNFVFGWAKPVPVNWSQLRNPRRDMALVTAAGPLSNLLMALFWTVCLKIAAMLHPQTSVIALFLWLTARAGIIINLVLAFLNLIPIPPLDGSKILASFLPRGKVLYYYLKMEPYGFFVLLILMFTGVLGMLINPPINWSLTALSYLFKI